MKIRVKAGDRYIRISIPNWFLTSRFGMRIALGWLAKSREESAKIAHMPQENSETNTESWPNTTHLTNAAEIIKENKQNGASQACPASQVDKTSQASTNACELHKPTMPSSEMLSELRRVLKQIKKQYGDFPLLEITTEEGESVIILL